MDEYHFLSQVYQFGRSDLPTSIQTVHTRLFSWLPLVSDDIYRQLEFARLCMLGCEATATAMVVKLAGKITDRSTGLLAGLAYISAGYVFMHGFAFRTDPMATALLMTALYVFFSRPLSIQSTILAGTLIGFSGAITIKSIFYAPCFAGAAFYHLRKDGPEFWHRLGLISLAPAAAVATFGLVILLHGLGISADTAASKSVGTNVDLFLSDQMFQFPVYIKNQFLLSPVIALSLAILSFVILKYEMKVRVFLVSLLLLLTVVVFYRNVFPYFFVFLFAPICVAIAPSLRALNSRFGIIILIPICMVAPAFQASSQLYHVAGQHRALSAEIRRLFPKPTGYIANTPALPDYPKLGPIFVSGPSLRNYTANQVPVLANGIKAGNVGFVLADNALLEAALSGKVVPGTLMKRDFSALHENFIHFSNIIWVAGKRICSSDASQWREIVRPERYTVDGGTLIIDDRTLMKGQSIALSPGKHAISYHGEGCVNLWALPTIPHVKRPLDQNISFIMW